VDHVREKGICGEKERQGGVEYTCTLAQGHLSRDHFDGLRMVKWPGDSEERLQKRIDAVRESCPTLAVLLERQMSYLGVLIVKQPLVEIEVLLDALDAVRRAVGVSSRAMPFEAVSDRASLMALKVQEDPEWRDEGPEIRGRLLKEEDAESVKDTQTLESRNSGDGSKG
jgi:hypothetical protein